MRIGSLIFLLTLGLSSFQAYGFTANRVWYELTPKGYFRVTVSYTVPALREFREVYTDFKTRPEAEKFYWSMVRGGDFSLSDPSKITFAAPPLQPRPW